MGFHLLCGIHPSTLMDHALDRICEEAIQWPTRRGYIIVPEKMKAEVERRYIEILQAKRGKQDDGSAFMMIDVVSFSRFAYRVLSEVGGVGGKTMSSVERTILIHRILQEDKEDFSLLSHFSERVGFVRSVDEVLGDFYRYDVSPEMLTQIDRKDVDPITSQKITDFGVLMQKMDAMRQQYGFVPERFSMKRLIEVLKQFAAKDPSTKEWPLKRLSFLQDASVWILGFAENRVFTPEEFTIVSLLEQVTSKVTMTAVSESKDGTGTNDICHFGNQTVRAFAQKLPFASVTMVEERPKTDIGLAQIASDYAARSASRREDLCAPVEIRVFQRVSDELEYVAARIRELVESGKMQYRDITVVLCESDKYNNGIHAAFAKYGLDVFLDSKSRLIGTSWMQYVQAILDMCCHNWRLPYVMNLLKSGFVAFPPEEVQRFENFCLAHGLRNKKKILDCVSYAKNDWEKQYLTRFAETLENLDQNLKSFTSARSCQARAIALHNLLMEKKSQLEYWVNEWSKGGNQEASLALAASYNVMDDALLALSGELGQFNISLDNFCNALISAVATQSLGKIPSFVDQVTVTDPSGAYRRPCKVMFVVGSNRKNFPYSSPSEGYLKNREREVIAEKLSIAFPNHAKDQSYADFFTACALLDTALERIEFTVQNSVEPSSVVLFLTENYPKIQTKVVNHLQLGDPRMILEARMKDYLREVITRRVEVDDDEMNDALYMWKTHFNMQSLSSENPQNTELQIPPELIDQHYHDNLHMSVSGVEKYVMCPYNFFSENILNLQEREVQMVKPTEMGTIAHSIMELALNEYHDQFFGTENQAERQKIHVSYLNRDKRAWAEELLVVAKEREPFAYSEDIAMQTEADTKLLRAASETLQEIFEQIDPDSYVPVEFEMKFGLDGLPGYEMNLQDGRSVTFNGTIDRVDLNQETKEFRIVDYKTGTKEIAYDALYAGASVQLPAYMHMYQKMHPGYAPTGVSYMHVTSAKNKTALLDERLDPESVAKAKGQATQDAYGKKAFFMQAASEDMTLAGELAIERIRDNCEQIFSGTFPSRPGRYTETATMDCGKCKMAFICNGDIDHRRYRDLNKLPESSDGKSKNKEARYWKAVKGEQEDETNS